MSAVDERPLPPVGLSISTGQPMTYCCWRCADSIDTSAEPYWLTSVWDAWSRPVTVAYHRDECPPTRRCPYCTLVADHTNDCPLSTEPTVVMRPVTETVARLIGEA